MPRRDHPAFHPTRDDDIITRVVKRRRQECASLESKFLISLVRDIEGKSDDITDPRDQFEHVLRHHFEAATDDSLPSNKRRTSWSLVQSLLSKFDTQLAARQVQENTRHNNTSRDNLSSGIPAAASATSVSTKKVSKKINGSKALSDPIQKAIVPSKSGIERQQPSVTPRTTKPLPILPVHPSMLNATIPHTTTAEASQPPPYQRHSNTSIARAIEKDSRRKTRALENLPVHPSFEESSMTNSSISRVQPNAPTGSDRIPSRGHAPSEGMPLADLVEHSPRSNQASSGSSQSLQTAGHPAIQGTLLSNSASTSAVQGTANLAGSKHESSRPSQPATVPAFHTQTNGSGTAASLTSKNPSYEYNDDMYLSDGDDEPVQKARKPMATLMNNVVPTKKAPEKPTVSNQTTISDFVEDQDNSPFSASLKGRNAVSVFFRKQTLTGTMSRDVGVRFAMWEPNWNVVKVVHLGLTCPVDKLVWKNRKNTGEAPKTAASFGTGALTWGLISLVTGPWGRGLGAPKDGDCRLILRMIPLKVDAKKKRADCHLWPKGTFLTIDGTPVKILQRKQQSHDAKLWKGMCHHLDVTSLLGCHIQDSTINILCRDGEQFIISLAICKYQSPDTLTKHLMMDKQHFQTLSYEESLQKAIALANQQMVVVDGSDDDTQVEHKKFVFSLVCPLSKLPMVTPVRGKKCKHWQVSSTHSRVWLKRRLPFQISSQYYFYSVSI